MNAVPICVECGLDMRCFSNDGLCLETPGIPGQALYRADIWQCPQCKNKIAMSSVDPCQIDGDIDTAVRAFRVMATNPVVVEFWHDAKTRERYQVQM